MRLIWHLAQRLRERRDRRATLRELRRLSPRQLCDIGLDVDQIEAVVDGLLTTRREQADRSGPERPARGVALALRASDRCC